jgi:NAD-dependent dihydropyrimidine dehydrogenase PreA subunit
MKTDKKKSFKDLVAKVVDQGECSSCGTCKAVCPSQVIVLAGEYMEPTIVGDCVECGLCYDSCPGLSSLQSGS